MPPRRSWKERGVRPISTCNQTKSPCSPAQSSALFADLGEGVRLGADQAGVLRRTAEFIGKDVA